jgi:putative ABC transport system permease protein
MIREFANALMSAARSFRRRPAFLAIASLTLGIALAFSTTILGVLDGVRHPPVPFDDPDRTFKIWYWGGGDRVHPGVSVDELYSALSQLPAFDAITRSNLEFPFIQIGERVPVGSRNTVAHVPQNFFRVLGVRPRLGRAFADDEASKGNSAIVSDNLWRTEFQDRKTIGTAEITLGDQPYAIVGVMPLGMNVGAQYDTDVWVPRAAGDTSGYGLPTMHLRPGVMPATALAQLTALANQFTSEYHVESRPYGFRLEALRREPKSLGGGYYALLALALSILVIACANIATLMLARALARRRELALRLSLGASTRALVLAQLAESSVLAVSGGAAGLILALWGLGGVSHFMSGNLNWLANIAPHWSWRCFGLSLAASAIVALLTGVLPAWHAARIQPMEPLKESSGGNTAPGLRRVRFLVAGELALSLALLVGATLHARSTLNLAQFHFGYDASHVVSVSGLFVYRNDIQAIGSDNPVEKLLPLIAATKGVERASTLAIGHPDHAQVFSDRTVGIKPLLAEDYLITGAHFMRTMGLQLLAGRDFEPGDEFRGAVILDERAVRPLFPDGQAIGHSIRLGGDDGSAPWVKVIGVARAADLWLPKYLDEGPRWPPIYASIQHRDQREWQVVARVSGEVPLAKLRISRELSSVLSKSVRQTVIGFSSDYDGLMTANMSLMRLFGAIGLAALALAAAGLFAVISYAVNQRMREFAVRVAIGARRGHVLRLVFRDVAELALAGTAAGAFVGFYAGSVMEQGLYGVKSTDVVALVIAEGVLLAVAFGACVVPALRATRADPVDVLRAN